MMGNGNQPDQPLILPHQHPLSLRLAAQAEAFQSSIRIGDNNTSRKVVNCRVLSPGLVELIIRAGDVTSLSTSSSATSISSSSSGYGSRTWPVRIGGAGIGDDPSMAAMLGDLAQVRAPIAVRFAVPIALYGVDDAGFCDASFWSPQSKSQSSSSHNNNKNHQDEVDSTEPTLMSIAATIIQWLEGAHVADTAAAVSLDTSDDPNNDDNGDAMRDRQQRWKEAEQHATKTMDVIRQYADMRRSSIISSIAATTPTVLCSRIEPEWIVPALRPCFLDTTTTTPSTVLDLDWPSLVTEVGPGIYEFDLFSHDFCNALIDEVDAFELSKLPCRRPNTMNKLGLVVNDMGLEPIMTCIVERLIAPMCKALYRQEEICSALDHHHSFVVRYRTKTCASSTSNDNGQAANDDNDDGSSGLDMHHDASEATLNICLGRDDFTSGGLRFCGHHGDANHRKTQLVQSHLKGRAILHLGRHRHGADNITSGERINLIVWARNSAYRGAAAFGNVKIHPVEKELGVPDKLCLSKSNDRDFEEKMKLFVPGTKRKIRPKLTF